MQGCSVQCDTLLFPGAQAGVKAAARRGKEGMLTASGAASHRLCNAAHAAARHLPLLQAMQDVWGIPVISLSMASLPQSYFAYMVRDYKILFPPRRDTEPERLKARNFDREESLLAGLGTPLTKAR